jgi:hypothetical protein
MSLYRNLINEALEEDQRANREVVERLKKNYLDNKEKLQEGNDISSYQLSIVQRLVNLIAREVNTAILMIQNDIANEDGQFNLMDYIGRFGDITIRYNNLAIYLKNINYNRLNKGSQTKINAIANKLSSSLLTLENFLNPENGFVLDEINEATNFEATINEIYNQINNNTFNNVDVLEEYESKEIRGQRKEKETEKEAERREKLRQAILEQKRKELRNIRKSRKTEEKRRKTIKRGEEAAEEERRQAELDEEMRRQMEEEEAEEEADRELQRILDEEEEQQRLNDLQMMGFRD